jgi:nitroreductase
MTRIADSDIDPLFLNRWSPRAMSGEAMSESDLLRLFEAARWAPSSGNGQPWRFLYARAGTDHFAKFFGLLSEGNRPWCVRAGALAVVLSRKTFEDGRPSPTHSYDTGAAWMSLALQGSILGFVVHGMAGFDRMRARAELSVPENYDVEAMIALGHPGRIEDLPERYRARDVKSGRKPVREFAFEGAFPAPERGGAPIYSSLRAIIGSMLAAR